MAPNKNGDLTPQKISYGYDKKVWWRCTNGHEWQAARNARPHGRWLSDLRKRCGAGRL